jgi:type VII secretion integral membrane protein EccD
MSVSYTRVTLVGEARRVDMVLPATEAVGRLLPDLLTVVGEPAGRPARLRRLVTVGGTVLGDADTLAGAEIADGTVLRLAGADDLPPAPVIHDVTEETADDLDLRATRWGPRTRRWVASTTLTLIVAVAAVLTYLRTDAWVAAVGIAAAGSVLAVIGVACGPVRRPLGVALLAGAGAALTTAAWAFADAYGWPPLWRIVGVSAALGVTVMLLGMNVAAGRAARLGGIGVLTLAAVWAAGAAAGLPHDRLAAVLTVVVVLAIGVLPRLALSWSGLAMLDDRRVEDRPVARREVRAALAAAHGSLIVMVGAVAASAVFAGWLLASRPTLWTVPLAALLAVVLLARARMYPLAAQVIALLGAAATILAVLWWRWASATPLPGPLAVAGLTLVLPVIVLARDLPEHTRARLRRLGELSESAAVLGLLPLVLGVFGVYPRLLEVFGP